MSSLAIFGATGYVGGHLVAEALARGHRVTAVSRTGDDTQGHGAPEGIVHRAGSLDDAVLVAEVAAGADLLVSAVPGGALVSALPVLIAAGREGPRIGVVGGAGSLRVAPQGTLLKDTPEFPDEARAEATAQAEALATLRADDSGLDWFYLSPAATFGAFAPGERLGTYRIGGDDLVTDEAGESAIGGADYAIAFLDEIESPAHHNVRFTVAY